MATCRTRNPNATAPRRVPAPLQGASGAAPPLLRSADEGKRSRSALTGTRRPLRASDGFGHLKGLGFLFRRATRLLSGA